MFKLLVEYSVEKKVKIIINENDIEKIISKNLKFVHLKNVSEINSEFIKLIYLYKMKNIIKVIFSENSYFLKKIIEYCDTDKKKRERTEKENKLLKEQLEKERTEKENKLLKEQLENERIEKENKLLKEQLENERVEQENKLLKEQLENERIEKENKLLKEQLENERVE
ncbi:hypothetical protein H8356DRAFT_1071411 [Neocallimastix lanati (nom. inval.)]|nr:hypothetical protein H8356DRAFT_1071411 [Neocallimastix sp. JGI-2020a]